MVASLGLLDAVQVGFEGLLALPRGAVDALQHLVLLVAAPVRRGAAHQLERRDPLGGGQVRTTAQVAPRDLAVASDVVVDGQLAATDLDRGALGALRARATLEADQLDLVGLVLELAERVGIGGDPALEALALLDDLAHRGLDLRQVIGHEGHVDVEVVVEAVLHRRADAQARLREELLDGLRHHVGGGVTQDVEPVGAVHGHALDLVTVRQHVGEVLELARHARGDDLRGVGVQLPGLGARRDRPLLTRIGVGEGDLDLGHDDSFVGGVRAHARTGEAYRALDPHRLGISARTANTTPKRS
ncbi:unannotated protein [freshwater metagenome]|uniref:Unannotated protein n=1 Tax=freshwater metagenome TaxID=449393 RepID=A0A6J6SFJ9_9ZZZZ